MAINLSSGTESLFARWGKLIGGINENSLYEGIYANNRAINIGSSYSLTNQDVTDQLYTNLASQNTSANGWMTYLSGLCSSTVIDMGLEDSPPIPSADLTSALDRVITQMQSTSQSIQRPVVNVTVTATSGNVGNGVCIASVNDATDGTVNPYVHAETVTATCTADGYPGGSATANQEPFSVRGELAVSNLSWNWPKGSGASTTTQTVNPSQTGGIVTNGGFETWPSATSMADGWSISTGTINSTVVRATGSNAFRGTYACQFVGNGTELTSIRQTLTALAPDTVYGINMWVRTDGSVAAGVLNIRLIDGGGTVINDNAGNPISFTQNVNSLTSSFTAFSNWILTPSVMPSTVQLEIRLSTAMTSTEILNIDDVQIIEATRIYTGGPYMAIFTGSVPFATGDSFSLAFTNSLGTNSFVRSLDRVFDLKNLGLKFPTSGFPTISGALIS